jgi:hypothetical protein
MRRSFLAALAAVVIAVPTLGIATPAVSEGEDTATPVLSEREVRCGNVFYRAAHVRPLARKAWHQRKGATHKQVEKYHSLLYCHEDGRKGYMKATWKRQKHDFYERRAEQRARLQNTPYSCGGAIGRSAIPCSIVECESHGDYEAQNDSGAYGKYQLMPEWWAPGFPSPDEQDAIAHDLWAGGAGAGNWQQCL